MAEESRGRYQLHARRARWSYQLSEVLFLVLSAAIPVSVVLWSGTAVVSAVLGAILVVLSGLRSVFHWHDNYVRFSRAREAVKAEQRLYLTTSEPYDDLLTRDRVLVAAVTRIEQQEMGQWIQAVSKPADQRYPPAGQEPAATG